MPTVDQWLAAATETLAEDRERMLVMRVGPAVYAAVQSAEALRLPTDQGVPRYGRAAVIVDDAFPAAGWCLLDGAEAEAISGGMLDPAEFAPPP